MEAVRQLPSVSRVFNVPTKVSIPASASDDLGFEATETAHHEELFFEQTV